MRIVEKEAQRLLFNVDVVKGFLTQIEDSGFDNFYSLFHL